MELLEKIKHVRTLKKVSQAEMADKLGIAQNNYGKIERGVTELTIQRLYQIAEILEVSIEMLMGLFRDSSFFAEKERYKEIDKENEELKKRILELEDRIKDKDKITLVLEDKIEKTNINLIGIIYHYTLSFVEELNVPFYYVNESDTTMSVIPLFFDYEFSVKNAFVLTHHLRMISPQIIQHKIKNVFIEPHHLKDVVLYCFGKYFDTTFWIYKNCINYVQDERFVKVWTDVLNELFEKENDTLSSLK
jgi:transcriptional regulator with XRE-family HTH domain